MKGSGAMVGLVAGAVLMAAVCSIGIVVLLVDLAGNGYEAMGSVKGLIKIAVSLAGILSFGLTMVLIIGLLSVGQMD